MVLTKMFGELMTVTVTEICDDEFYAYV